MRFVRLLFTVILLMGYFLISPQTVRSEGDYQFVTRWGSAGDRQLRSPSSVAVDASGNVYVTDTANNRIQKFNSSGVFITKWGSPGSGDGQFKNPQGIAVDTSGNVFVADSGNNRIQKFYSSGIFITKWGSQGSGDGQLNYPWGIAVDAGGDVYVADSSNNRIQMFSPAGVLIAKWGSQGTGNGQFKTPSGIAVDASRNVYVVDTGNNNVQKFSSSGVFVAKWGLPGSGAGYFSSPSGIAVDASGNVYVADTANNRIQKFDFEGSFIAKWGSQGSGDGQFYFPEGIAADAAGNVYVADSGNNRIQELSSAGGVVVVWGAPIGDGKLQYPSGIAVDASENVYITDTSNNRIQKFSSAGAFIAKWGSAGTGNGQFQNPNGVAIDASGNLYIVDTGNNRVQKFSSAGAFIAKWGSAGTGNGQFQNPNGVAVDFAENVYVADSGNNCIQKFSPSGTFIAKWDAPYGGGGQFNNPVSITIDMAGYVYVMDVENNSPRIQKCSSSMGFIAKWGIVQSTFGIAVDAAGNLYVAGGAGHRVLKLSSSGNLITQWGSEGLGDGQFAFLTGIAVDSAGNVYVVDHDGWNVQKFSPVTPSSALPLYFPHVDTSLPWQTEIAIINTGDQPVTGTLRGLSDGGQLVDTKAINLPGRGRRQITVADEFINHTDIGYIIFDAGSAAVQGYTKFYQAGVYRAAVPAVKEANTSDIYVSHIDSSSLWWTGVSLVNTTATVKDLTVTFNTGQSRQISLGANQHAAFDIAGLFSGQPQPDIKSAVISNAGGVIGLELFGSSGGGNQLDGLLLSGNTTSAIYYPHVASDNAWWTGIVAYNPSTTAATITVTPYSAQGTPLSPSTLSIAGKGKYVGLISVLGLPANTAWFKVDSTSPLTGFELFATWDGNQLATYAGGGGAGAKAGVFPKIEKSGWTGIAFVNTEAGAASVTLTAYNDGGTTVATQVLPVGGHAKVVDFAEAIFSQSISGATYIAYSSDRNVVGFQLNGSSDGMMLDGLPALGGVN